MSSTVKYLRFVTINHDFNRRFCSQREAIAIDQQLFNDYQFSVDQLMELAGLACAQIVADVYTKHPRVLCLVGPGNNGGDGLVCARHLRMFVSWTVTAHSRLQGYNPSVYMCGRVPSSDLMKRLVHQTESMAIAHLPSMPADLDADFDLVVDALFGFSFRPPIRQPFDAVLRQLASTKVPIASIDIPSGWDVETGPDEVNNAQMTIKVRRFVILTFVFSPTCSSR